MRFYISILCILSLYLAQETRAAGPIWPISDFPRFWILGEGNSHFSLDTTYFHTKENYDGEGIVIQPSAMEYVRYTNARLHTGFGFTPTISVFGQADIRGLFAYNTANSNISDDDNYGFGDAFLAMRWLAYRSKSTNKVYPTEWSPKSWLLLAEGSWVFPMYDRAKPGKPPLGDQSNDLSILGRVAWYANEWLALSASAGYIYRTAGYSSLIPWSLRADFVFLQKQRLRLWAELKASEGVLDSSTTNVFNPKQADPIPGGSLLFKSQNPTLRQANLGLGYLLSKQWEIAMNGLFTTGGINAAKGVGGTLGLTWRPYQVPELRYEAYRQQEQRRSQQEPRVYKSREVLRHSLKATILRVSVKGNFFRIGYGSSNGVQKDDLFQVYEPDDFSGKERKPIAFARVVVARINDSFLRVEENFTPNVPILPGFEARRVIIEE